MNDENKKIRIGEFLVLCEKCYNKGSWFPVCLKDSNFKEVRIFGVYEVKPDALGGLYKVRLEPVDCFDGIRMAGVHEFHYDSVDDLILDGGYDAFDQKGYIGMYRFTDLDTAIEWAKSLNDKILTSLGVKRCLFNLADIARGIALKEFADLSYILNNMPYEMAVEQLCDSNSAWILKNRDKFDYLFKDIFVSIFKTEDGKCEIGRMVEVWNDMHTEGISVII